MMEDKKPNEAPVTAACPCGSGLIRPLCCDSHRGKRPRIADLIVHDEPTPPEPGEMPCCGGMGAHKLDCHAATLYPNGGEGSHAPTNGTPKNGSGDAVEPEQPTRIIGCPQCADTGKNVAGFRCRACELEQPTKRCIHGNPVGFGKCIECRDHMARLQDKTTNMPEPGSVCPTCQQQVVTSVSWVRHSHEDIADAEQRVWLDGSQHEAKATVVELERMLSVCEYAEVRAFLPLLIERLKEGGHRV